MVSYFSEKELFLNRLLPNGWVDSSFAESGQRKVAIGPLKYSVASLLLGGDNVLVSGMVIRSPAAGKSQPPYYYSIGVARFLSDGQGDSAFGPDGMQVLSIGAVNDRAASMMLQDNGRIVLVGSSEDQTQASSRSLLAYGAGWGRGSAARGNSESIWLLRQVGSLVSVSRSHAAGSSPLSFAVPSKV